MSVLAIERDLNKEGCQNGRRCLASYVRLGRLGEGAYGRGRAPKGVGHAAAGAPGQTGSSPWCSRCSRKSITLQFAFFSTYGMVLPRLNSPNRRL